MQDTKTPLFLSLGSIPLNILLSIILARRYGVVGLAMSASIVSVLETLTLAALLRRKGGSFGEGRILRGVLPMAVAGLIMAGVVYVVIARVVPLYAVDRGFFTLMPKFLLISVVGAVSYLVPCYLMRLDEAKFFLVRLRDIMVRSFNLT